MNRTAFAALSGGALAAALGVWSVTAGSPPPAAAAGPAVTAAEPAAAPSPAREIGTVVEPPLAAPAAVDRSRELELPDGTYVATLNGAVDAAPLARYWGPFPWSPIVGTERSSAGVDWYKHADGSYSTTQMVWRSDLGRHAAMTRVAHPGPAQTPAVAAK